MDQTEPPPELTPALWDDKQLQLFKWRYDAARKAGLNPFQAKAFAESRADIGELRDHAAAGCAADLIVRLLL